MFYLVKQVISVLALKTLLQIDTNKTRGYYDEIYSFLEILTISIKHIQSINEMYFTIELYLGFNENYYVL